MTEVGLLEPMRVEDEYQRRGLARAMLTEGLERLAQRGARRLKVGYATEIARALYVGAGFRVTETSTTYRWTKTRQVTATVYLASRAWTSRSMPSGSKSTVSCRWKPSFSITRRDSAFPSTQMLTRRGTPSTPKPYSALAAPPSVASPRPVWAGSISQPSSGSSGHARWKDEADPADELARLAQLHGPDAEAVLVPVAAVAGERLCGLLARHRRAPHVPHHERIAVPARDRVEILVAPQAQPQPRRLELSHVEPGHSSSRRNTTHALCPPKPNEFETPTWIGLSRASFGM